MQVAFITLSEFNVSLDLFIVLVLAHNGLRVSKVAPLSAKYMSAILLTRC